jgi:alpha-L-fucosidase 2
MSGFDEISGNSRLPAGPTSRRNFLRAGGTVGAMLAVGALPPFTAHADVVRPAAPSIVPPADATSLWYPAPGAEATIIQEGLPIGNGRLGALVTGDPAQDALYLTDSTLWTGGLNAALGSDGQFPYDTTNFGTLSPLAKVYVKIPAHTGVTGYRRQLDLSNGVVSAGYRIGRVQYRREVYASHPDDVVIVRLTQSGGGSYTGSVALTGTHGESTTADTVPAGLASFSGALANGLAYGAVATVAAAGGTVSADGGELTFRGCREVLLVICGGTNYVPNPATMFMDPAVDPTARARTKATAAAAVPADVLLATHVADYQSLYGRLTVNLGRSSQTQRAMDTASRLAARAADSAAPDPELEASYLQFGRYLMISGSRTSVPLNLQGLWLDSNNPAWMADYHTDINVEMNYWLADRASLGDGFTAYADYLLAQLPCWTEQTQKLFNDPNNWFRNSSGKVAGWTTAISTNVYGGLGWWWHPAGNAWLCNSLYEHYQYTKDADYLRTIYPMLKGACEFWEARLIAATVTEPDGSTREVLIDDSDWSPEQGPTDAKGITYAQELVCQLFGNYTEASALLRVDSAYAATISGLRGRLYLPVVSPVTGWLEEWMTPENLGDPAHRHLSPLIGFFPGDRINLDASPAELITGVRNLLTARGMNSFGWGMAWRGACWARLKNADNAYRAVMTVLEPSVNYSNGASINFFDMYSFGTSSTFQIDANFGTPAAMLEMLLYSRPGVIELLPALPSAWAASGHVSGIGARGGFVVDFSWENGDVTTVTIRSVGGTSTTVRSGAWNRDITLPQGGSVALTPAIDIPVPTPQDRGPARRDQQ